MKPIGWRWQWRYEQTITSNIFMKMRQSRRYCQETQAISNFEMLAMTRFRKPTFPKTIARNDDEHMRLLPAKIIQNVVVCAPNMEGKTLFFGGGEVVTGLKAKSCSRMAKMRKGSNGKVLVVDGHQCDRRLDFAQSAVDKWWGWRIVYMAVCEMWMIWAKCQLAYKRSAPFPANPIAKVWAMVRRMTIKMYGWRSNHLLNSRLVGNC